jgi:hypothetical protein
MNEQEQQWLTGFTEGDGSIHVASDGWSTVRILYGQKDRNVLEYILTLVGEGVIRKSTNPIPHYTLEYAKQAVVVPLLETFSKHAVGKPFIGRLSAATTRFNLPQPQSHPPATNWLIGFWDAEGSSGTQPSITVSQKDPHALEAIKAEFGGKVDLDRAWNGYKWRLHGNAARKLYPVIAAGSHAPKKAEKLLHNFTGPEYEEHKKEYAIRSHKRWLEIKRTREYIRNHPETLELLKRRLQ